MAGESAMYISVNAWSVQWREDRRWKSMPCSLKVRCKGEQTQGAAHFKLNGETQRVGSGPCCKGCAIEYVSREGLRGCITFEQIKEALGGNHA